MPLSDAERRAAMRARRRAAGLCPQCGRVPPVAGGKLCAACRAVQRAKQARHVARRSPETAARQAARTNAWHKQWWAALRQSAIAHYGGPCAHCGTEQALVLHALREVLGPVRCTEPLVARLARAGWPPGLRAVCRSCLAREVSHGRCHRARMAGP